MRDTNDPALPPISTPTTTATAPAKPSRPGAIPDLHDPASRKTAVDTWLRARRPIPL